MINWKTKRIDQLGRVVTGKTPSSDRLEEFGGIYPFITPSDIPATQKHILVERYLSEKGMHAHRRIKLPEKSVCVVCIGATIGKVCMTDQTSFSNQQINSIIPFNGYYDADFVYYISTTLRDSLVSFAGGAATPIVNKSTFSSIKLLVPEFEEQRKIAATLSAYDDLIQNNQQRISLLDKMAEDIYREWFVRLRFPENEKIRVIKGIPEGWKVKTLGEIIKYYIGGGWGEDEQSTSFSEEGYVIRGTDIPNIQKGNFTVCPFRFHKPSNLKSRKLQPNDFVFEVSGGSTNQLLGRNIHITESFLNFFDAPVIAASFCKLIRFRQDQVSSYFMKYFMKLYYDCDLVGIYQIQSTGISNYQFESFLKYQTIVLPPTELQKKFDDLITPILDMRDKISLANIQLKKSRDLLLPRLISGKLSVEHLDIQFPPSMLEESEPLST